MMATRDADDFLVLNGIQTMSAKAICLAQECQDAVQPPDIMRISPQSADNEAIIDLFDALREDTISTTDAIGQLQTVAADGLCNGYWHDAAGMHSLDRAVSQ